MKAIQIVEPGRAELVDVPAPEAGEGEVLVRVKTCVTCPHWDISLFKGVDIFERPGYPKYPIPPGYPGHEMAGDVIAVGSGVSGFNTGDRVATLRSGGETNPGCYSEYVSRPEADLVKIPDNISYEAAANMEMARYVSPYVRALGDIEGRRIGLVGLGPAGCIALQYIKSRGAGEIVAMDLMDERLGLAEKLGATRIINTSKTENLKELEENPLQGCVDCTGAAAGFQIALDHTFEGPVSIFGVIHGNGIYTTRYWRARVYIAERVKPTDTDTEIVLDLWRKGELDTDILVAENMPFDRYAEGMALIMEHKALKIGFYPDRD